MTWSDIVAGPLPEEVFATSKACTNYPMPACEETGTVMLDVYRIHGVAEPFSLDDRNAGDTLGDMAFTCQTGGAGFGGKNTVVSWWKVEVSKAFGQYAYCLYDRVGQKNYCNGGTGKAVGRESANGLGAGRLQGQCGANPDVGTWYSLPSAGRCADGQPIGTNGCSWLQPVRIRTVNSTCIVKDRGLSDTCKQEYGHAPLSKSAAIFAQALASNDPSKGGCPDISLHGKIVV